MPRPRTIAVTPVLNGWRVQVDCQEVVYTDLGKLIADFSQYMTDPDAVEKRIIEGAINRKFTLGPFDTAENVRMPDAMVGGGVAAAPTLAQRR